MNRISLNFAEKISIFGDNNTFVNTALIINFTFFYEIELY